MLPLAYLFLFLDISLFGQHQFLLQFHFWTHLHPASSESSLAAHMTNGKKCVPFQPLPIYRLFYKYSMKCRACQQHLIRHNDVVYNSPSHPAPRDASPLWDGAFGTAASFPVKLQSFRLRQRLPLRGSWQNRQVLTEGVFFQTKRTAPGVTGTVLGMRIRRSLPRSSCRLPASA